MKIKERMMDLSYRVLKDSVMDRDPDKVPTHKTLMDMIDNEVLPYTSKVFGGIVTSGSTGTGQLTFNTNPVFVQSISTPKIKPVANSTTAFQVTKADGTTPILTIDTLNGKIYDKDGIELINKNEVMKMAIIFG